MKVPEFSFQGGNLKAKQISIAFEPYLLERRIELLVRIADPLIALNGDSLQLEELFKKLESSDSLLNYHVQVEVDNGCAISEHLPPLYFDIRQEFSFHHQCEFRVGFTAANQVRGSYIFQDNKSPLINLYFENFDLQAASGWSELFYPGALGWKAEAGHLDGSWTVNSNFLMGIGDFKITDLMLASVDNPFSIHIPSLASVKEEAGTMIVVERKGNVKIRADEDFSADLYHFGGELFLNKKGKLMGKLGGFASIGVFQPGLQVDIDVDQELSDHLFQYHVKGPFTALLTEMPPKYQQVIDRDFVDTLVNLDGTCRAIDRGVEFHSNLSLARNGVDILQDVALYCRVDPTTSNFIDEGHFIAPKVNLEAIISPFLFVDKQLRLSGSSYFEGNWDPSLMHIRYRPDASILESDYLTFDIPAVVETGDIASAGFTGEHFFDFERNHQYGRLYIQKGMYLEKRTGLLFTDVNTQMVFEGKSLHATQLQTYSQGIYFEGGIDLDYSSPLKKTFDLDLTVEKMEGKVSQFQSFIAHFPQPMLLQNLPIEGKIINGRGDNKISLHFMNGKCTVGADVRGVLVEGATSDPEAPIRADALSFEFVYHHENRSLGLKNVAGFLRIGKPETEHVFRIQGDGIHFKDYLQHEGDFSIALRDDRHEWIKLAGDITPVQGNSKNDLLRINFDPGRSHLHEGQPIHCVCEVRDWEELEDLDLSFQLKVPGIVKEIRQGVDCGLFEMSEPFVEKLDEWLGCGKAEGQLFVKIGYDRNTSLINIQTRGKQIRLGDHQFGQVNLEAKKRYHTWMIEQLQLDDFSLSADLQRNENDWKLNFLGLRWGDALLAGLEGDLFSEKREIKAKVNLFEFDCLKASLHPRFKSFCGDNNIKGDLKGVGELTFKLIDTAPGWMCDVLGTVNTSSLCYEDITLTDASNVSFHLLSNHSVSFRNMKTVAMGVNWGVEKFSYSPKVHEIQLENVSFQYPVENSSALLSTIESRFPGLLEESIKQSVLGLKSEGNVAGVLDLTLSENTHQMNLRLQDGIYSWKGDPYRIQNFALLSTPNEKTFVFQTDFEKLLPWVSIKTGNGEKGTLLLAEQNPIAFPGSNALMVDWKNPTNRPLSIEKVSGSSFGITANLLKRGEEYGGSVALNLPEIAPLLNPEHLQAVQKSQLKGSYFFEGSWRVPFERKGWIKELAFLGRFSGTLCSLKGYCYDHIAGDCRMNPGQFILQNCLIGDMAFEGGFQSLSVDYENEPAKFHLANFQIENLRPYLLKKDPLEEPSGKKNLKITQLQIPECSGILSQPESYQGSGFCTFATETRKGIESTPFALPAEILSRIGLNSSIMTPVSGTAIFNIANGRFYISKLKDSYSQGKLSKFYIYNSKEPSYIDFDSNLHLQVRVKHYNLLFKLSEMLTIHVRGSLHKPLYYLQKQPKEI